MSCFCCGRRGFLKGLASTGFLAATAGPLFAQAPSAPRSSLPGRRDFVLRNAYVMSMDPVLGDVPNADVHVVDGAIRAVGPNLTVAPDTEVIDARGKIVLPGLIDTHWHMWGTLYRSISGDRPEDGYFPSARRLGTAMKPIEMYLGTRLAAAEAIHSGITYVNNWSHNVRSPEFAAEDLRAMREAGLRGRYSYGYAQGQLPTQAVDLADIEQMHSRWGSLSGGGLLSLGLAWRGSILEGKPLPKEIYRTEIDTARRLGLPISVHANLSRSRAGQVAAMANEPGLLGPDVQLIHMITVTPEEIAAVKAAGCSISLSPLTELRIGFGLPRTGEFLAAGIPTGLSVDTTALSGNADMFGVMKVIQNVENGLRENEFALPARRVLELATIEGAKSMGMDASIGSLKPGKRADLIVVSTTDVNMGVFTDPAHMIVEAAQPVNVTFVAVDGRILKRDGRLTAMDPAKVTSEAAVAFDDLRKRAAMPPR